MGSYFAKQMTESVEEKFKGKGEEMMTNFQKKSMNNQFHAQALASNKQMAMQIAKMRETIRWTGSFAAIASTGLLLGFIRTKKPAMLIPLLPFSFGIGFQAHMAYGDKLPWIRAEAEHIIKAESHLLGLPLGPVTYDEVIQNQKECLKVYSK